MRIRKEVAPPNSRMFMGIALIVFVVYSILILLAKVLDGEPLFTISYTWVFTCLIQPLILGYVFSNASRKLTLFVNDYQNIDSFKDRLNQHVLNKGVRADLITETRSLFVATGWFYQLFNHWRGVETVTIDWGDEIVIAGSSRIVSQIEDSLIWNPAFK